MAEDQSFSALQSSLWREGTFKVVYCPRNEPVPPDPHLQYEVSASEYRGMYADLRGAREQVHRQAGEILRLRQQADVLTAELRQLSELLRRAEAERDGYLADINNLWDIDMATDTEGTDGENEASPEPGTVEGPHGSRRPSLAARRLSVAARKLSDGMDGSEDVNRSEGLASDFLGASQAKTAKSPEKIKRALKASYEKKKKKEVAKLEAGYEKIISQMHKERDKLQQQFCRDRDKFRAQIKDMAKQLRSRKAEHIVYTEVPRRAAVHAQTQTEFQKRDVYEAVRTVVSQVKELKKENAEISREKDKAARQHERKVDAMKTQHQELLQTKVSLENDVRGLQRKVAFYEARESYRHQSLPSVSPQRGVGGPVGGKRDEFVEENLLEGSRRNSMRSLSVVSVSNTEISSPEGLKSDVFLSRTQPRHGKGGVSENSAAVPTLPLISGQTQGQSLSPTSKGQGQPEIPSPEDSKSDVIPSPEDSKSDVFVSPRQPHHEKGGVAVPHLPSISVQTQGRTLSQINKGQGQLDMTRLPRQDPVRPTVAVATSQTVARKQMSKYKYQQKAGKRSPSKQGVTRVADSEAARLHNVRNFLRPLLSSSQKSKR